MGYSPWDHKELDMTELLNTHRGEGWGKRTVREVGIDMYILLFNI